nr:unnamed protein product [Callosobruchus analis]
MSKDIEETIQIKEEIKELLPGYANMEQFTKEGYKVLIGAIKQCGTLPSGSDWNYYNAHDSFKTIMANESSKLLSNINTILSKNNVGGNIKNRGLEEKTELMIDANDTMLERVADNIDEMNGIKKKSNEPVVIQTVSAQLPVNGSWNRANNPTFSVSASLASQPSYKTSANAIRLVTGKNIERHRNFFKDKIINSTIFLEQYEDREEYSHPYEFELDRFAPLPEQLLKEEPIIPQPIEQTPLYEIDQPEQIEALVETLRTCKEFAVDLEHHSYRSFMGITCLLQISTRDADYIIDTLALRDKLHLLNEVFTKPSILKIFHGAEFDIQWLQRDLSIYEFQLADWRIRPLPNELKQYARGDTHYLIYIYQMMKNDLLNKANGQDNLLLSTIMKEDTRARGTTKKISKINVDSPIHCPHDLTKAHEFRDDMPTLLDNKISLTKELLHKELQVQKHHSMYAVFNVPDKVDHEFRSEGKTFMYSFLGPFERYKLVKPYIQAEEQRLAEEKAKEEQEKAKARAENEIAEQNAAKDTPMEADTRTDEERIESIRQHFLTLSRLPAWEELAVQNQSLVKWAVQRKGNEMSLAL